VAGTVISFIPYARPFRESLSLIAVTLLASSLYIFTLELLPLYLTYPVMTSLLICPYAVYARYRLQTIDGFLEVENR